MKLLLGTFLILLGQVVAWLQVHGQFFSEWMKKNTLPTVMISGIGVGLCFIHGTKLVTEALDGSFWAARLITFAMGIISFAILTKFILNEAITPKTLVVLTLAIVIVLIQVIWK